MREEAGWAVHGVDRASSTKTTPLLLPFTHIWIGIPLLSRWFLNFLCLITFLALNLFYPHFWVLGTGGGLGGHSMEAAVFFFLLFIFTIKENTIHLTRYYSVRILASLRM